MKAKKMNLILKWYQSCENYSSVCVCGSSHVNPLSPTPLPLSHSHLLTYSCSYCFQVLIFFFLPLHIHSLMFGYAFVLSFSMFQTKTQQMKLSCMIKRLMHLYSIIFNFLEYPTSYLLEACNHLLFSLNFHFLSSLSRLNL